MVGLMYGLTRIIQLIKFNSNLVRYLTETYIKSKIENRKVIEFKTLYQSGYQSAQMKESREYN